MNLHGVAVYFDVYAEDAAQAAGKVAESVIPSDDVIAYAPTSCLRDSPTAKAARGGHPLHALPSQRPATPNVPPPPPETTDTETETPNERRKPGRPRKTE